MTCSDCGHGKRKVDCAICSDCGHGKRKGLCPICSDCGHGKLKSWCAICSDCGHGKVKRSCSICDPNSHLSGLIRSRLSNALKQDKELHTFEYLGASLDVIRPHLESTFTEGMSWENIGQWHIDHVIPLAYKVNGIKPTHEEVIQRLHFTNLQALWATDNISKGNRFIG